jgi:hypothetical protein
MLGALVEGAAKIRDISPFGRGKPLSRLFEFLNQHCKGRAGQYLCQARQAIRIIISPNVLLRGEIASSDSIEPYPPYSSPRQIPRPRAVVNSIPLGSAARVLPKT